MKGNRRPAYGPRRGDEGPGVPRGPFGADG